MPDKDRRFIEESFPVKEVSQESAREKNIRHGHISTLHIWWARRPLASSRATNYAALIPAPKDIDEWDKKRRFIIELCKWENSLRQDLLEKARKDILEANGGKPPRVLDPFGGGGAIPLEALRLGCEVYSNDYNPVAVLIQKCTLEYPQRYSGFGVRDSGKKGESGNEKFQGIRSLAEGNEPGSGGLQNDETLTTGREIQFDFSNSASSCIHTSQHSGGMGEGINKGIYSISVDSKGFTDGVRDASNCSGKTWVSDSHTDRKDSEGDRGYRDDAQSPDSKLKKALDLFPNPKPRIPNPLLHAVRYWGNWVLEEAKKEIGRFYPPDPDGSIPVGYIWARTIPCQNPSCGAEIPLMRQFWLAKKAGNGKLGMGDRGKYISLYPVVDYKRKRVDFAIIKKVKDKWEFIQLPNPQFPIPNPQSFDPENGTISRAVATCPVCSAVIDDKTTRRLFQEGKSGQRMVAVVLAAGNRQLPIANRGKRYRIATEKDMQVFKEAEEYLKEKRERLMAEWGMDPVPDEPLPPKETLGFRVQRYGILRWGDLFNSRQKLALITFVEKVRQAYLGIRDSGLGVREGSEISNYESKASSPEEYAKAVATYLAINLNRLASYCSSLGYWHISGEKLSPAMQRQALAMVFDYAESNPFAESFSWDTNLDWVLRVIDYCSRSSTKAFNTQSPIPNPQSLIPNPQSLTPNPQSHIPYPQSPVVTQSSATSLPYPDNFFDAVFTDPPYYDNVPYSYLSDFFYVWLKRSIGDLYPELFSTPLTPKTQDIVAYSNTEGGFEAGKRFFEDNLKKSFQEIHRVLKPDGITIIVYAHKSTEGWETLINSLLDSGLIITGAYPIHTEMQARLRASESAALASSIYIVARKMQRQPTGFYNQVKEELKQHLNKKLDRLWQEGISGADFFIAAIGSAIEVFGKYEKVMDYEGNIIRADRLLEDVRKIATDYAVHQILHNGFAGEISDLTRFYVLYRWDFGEAKVHFDEARKLATSCGIDLASEWNKNRFIKKEKEFIRVLGPHERQDIGDWGLGIGIGKLNSQSPISHTQSPISHLPSPALIDVLHAVLLLWEKGKKDDMIKLLRETGYGESEAFYRVAQAISETLPKDSKEKKLLDGFLAGRERVREEVRKASNKERLF